MNRYYLLRTVRRPDCHQACRTHGPRIPTGSSGYAWSFWENRHLCPVKTWRIWWDKLWNSAWRFLASSELQFRCSTVGWPASSVKLRRSCWQKQFLDWVGPRERARARAVMRSFLDSFAALVRTQKANARTYLKPRAVRIFFRAISVPESWRRLWQHKTIASSITLAVMLTRDNWKLPGGNKVRPCGWSDNRRVYGRRLLWKVAWQHCQ